MVGRENPKHAKENFWRVVVAATPGPFMVVLFASENYSNY